MTRGHWRFVMIGATALALAAMVWSASDRASRAGLNCLLGEVVVRSESHGLVCVPGRRAE